MIIAAAAAIFLLAQGWARPADTRTHDPVVKVQGYPRGPSREEMEWRRRHPEIPGYVPYTPGYGPYIDENGRSRWQGTPNPTWREEYPRIDHYYIFRCWRDGPCR